MPDQQRRLATIVFTDIVGFTKLTAENEPLALQLLDTQRTSIKPIVERFNGEWLKEIGDGLLLAFSTSKDAVDCCIEIQHTLKNIANLDLRIGIHQGEVIQQGGDVIGDDVNVASRVEPFAVPGGIVVTEPVNASLLRDPVYQTKLVGSPSLKGVRQTVNIHCITSHGLPFSEDISVDAKLEDAPTTPPVQPVPADTPLSQTIRDVQNPSSSKMPMIIGGVVLAIALVAGFMFMGGEDTPGGDDGESIAVLPFVNMSSDKENEYFSDGITEEILNYLAKIKNLRVISRTSVFTYKGRTDISIAEIGRQLDVRNVLEGSVRKAGNKVRITAQLIRSKDDAHLWSETYDRELEDIFAVQDEIAQTIVGTLKMDYISHSEQAAPTASETNIEAYNLYLQGIHFQSRRDEEGMRKALSLFKQTVRKDPNYPLAYVGLANTYLLLCDYGYDSFDEKLPLAEFNAAKAMELNPNLAEVQSASAYVSIIRKDDPKITEGYFLKAIEMNPNYATAYHWYSDFSRTVLRNNQKALEYIQVAKMLDPLSGIIRINLSNVYRDLNRLEEAESTLTSLLELNPNYTKAYGNLALIYRRQGAWEKAIQTCESWVELSPKDGNSHRSLGEIYMITGDLNNAIKSLKRSADLTPNSPISIEYLAFTCYLKQDFKAAKSYIEQGYNIAPNTPLSRMVEGRLYLHEKKYDKALAAFDDSEKGFVGLSPFLQAMALMGKGLVYAQMGDKGKAEKMMQQLTSFGKADGIQSLKAIVQLQLGQHEEGLAVIKKDIQEQNPYIYVLTDPMFDAFKTDSRYKEIIRLYNL